MRICARRCRRSVNEIDTRRDSVEKLIPGHFARNLIFQSEGILKLGIGVVNSYGVLFFAFSAEQPVGTERGAP